MLTQRAFKQMVHQYIAPLVAGTRLTGCGRSCPVFTATDKPSSLMLTLSPGSSDTLLLSRPQHFTPEEITLISSILAKWRETFASCPAGEAGRDVLAARCKLVAIAEFIDPECTALLLDILETMVDWSGQSYEGRRIAFAIGVENDARTGGSNVSFREAMGGDYLKVLTSSRDTLLVCGPMGGILRHESLFEPDAKTLDVLDDTEHNLYAPIMYLPIARWAASKRYAAVLNAEGEILLFKDGSLLFARRRGKWFFFTHSAYIAGLSSGKGHTPAVNKALYQTMLDVSFARTGGCLGLWHGERYRDNRIIAAADRLDTPGYPGLSHKNRFFRRVIDGRPFYALNRKLRMELAGVDGATVLLSSGEILTVGAILKIEGGSAGGGRTAAAMELAKRGIGVKISNDGAVAYWTSARMRRASLPPPTYSIG